MNQFRFYGFSDYEDGKIASLETVGEYEIPLNVFIDNASEFDDIDECFCTVDLYGIGSEIEVFSSEEAYRAADKKLAVISMIPIGTFSAQPDDESFQPSPHILFTGKVLYVERDPNAGADEPNYFASVETLELKINLYFRYDGPVEEGYIIYGVAWLYGDMEVENE
ncbi:MAG: hypothetical protein IJK23_00510 [Clostridia bacterium]|nr:hypothetical protein [Clostridia bacterium]